MKKLVTLSIGLALCAGASAESVQTLSRQVMMPGMSKPYDIELMGLGISPNGRYVCGAIESGAGIFIADTKDGNVIYTIGGDEGGELRHIDNNGLAVGVTDAGATYDYATDTETKILPPEGFKYVICEDITADGSMMIGTIVGDAFMTRAGYKIGDGDWQFLPVPTEEELGGIKTRLESAAKLMSSDGSVIFGHLGSFTVPIIWIRNEAGEYEYDFFPARYLKVTEEDLDDPSKPLLSVSAMYLALSDNGKYATMLGLYVDPESTESQSYSIPVIYNTETRDITLYSEKQAIDEMGSGLYVTAIANDGTFIGTIGMPYYGSRNSFIWEAGKPEPERYNTAFPAFDEIYGESDDLGFNVPTNMSADGRYLLGYTYYAEDYYSTEGDALYVTYIIDREGESGVKEIVGETTAAKVEAIYDINGNRVNGLTEGINIIRMSDGTSFKILKK